MSLDLLAKNWTTDVVLSGKNINLTFERLLVTGCAKQSTINAFFD